MKLKLRLNGMTCASCAKRIERALGAVPGVEAVHVSYGSKLGTVVTSEEANVDRLLDAVEEAGYQAEVMEPRTTPANTSATLPEAEYDLLVVGTGGAGTAAAIRGAALGARTAIVEGGAVVGGTCVNVGCIPSKNLIEAAAHYHAARTRFPGITPAAPQLAWDEVLRQKREIVETLRREKYLDVLASYPEITLLRGRARLLGEGRVQVGEQVATTRKVVLATGTRPAMPPIPGLREAGALDSTTAMELERLPASLVVLGAGSVGLELGQAFARFGVRVTVVDVADRILPNEDPEVSAALAAALEDEGITIHTGVRATRVSRTADGYVLSVEGIADVTELRADQLLVATGRQPNTEALGLEAAGVETDGRGFIRVDAYLRTTHSDVYAAGDVTGGPGFVYVAALGGGIAAQAALADRTEEGVLPIELEAVPRVTFTDPQVAAVGMTEAEARAAGLEPKVTAVPARHLPRAYVSYRRDGLFKLVAEAGTDRLLGVHVVAPNAGDLIGEAVLAVRFGLTTRDLVSTLHAYLTWGEGLKLAAQTFTKDVAKLSCCA